MAKDAPTAMPTMAPVLRRALFPNAEDGLGVADAEAEVVAVAVAEVYDDLAEVVRDGGRAWKDQGSE